MPVYFVYRCHYGSPSEKHVRRFEYDTVLDWAKGVFKQLDEDEAYKYAEELLGGLRVYSFGSMFMIDEEHGARTPPRAMKDVQEWFQDMYDQGEAHGPHHIQILTDDDEIQMAVYVFDDHYRKKHPGKADFLLLDGWELPAGDSDKPLPKLPKLPETDLLEPPGDAEGTLFAVSLYADDSSNLEDLYGAKRIDGLRLPDLARYLLRTPEEDDIHSDFAIHELRDNLRKLLEKPKGPDKGFLVAIRDHPEDLTSWGAYSDWLQDHDLPPAGLHLLELALRQKHFSGGRENRNPKFDCVKVTPHMAQASKNEGRWPSDKRARKMTDRDTFTQFIFFDDRWVAAHPTLATNILTFASRWDALT
ncbi:MAG: TIGR02996 domain-containing protein [Planctomycetia bacterium]|nr:TIGR02996 domain-containing protein [Planctomycetia bacterium]